MTSLEIPEMGYLGNLELVWKVELYGDQFLSTLTLYTAYILEVKQQYFFSNKVNEKNPHAYNSYQGFIVNINKT